MREIFGRAYKLAIITVAVLGASVGAANAQESTFINQSNITGFSLPGVSLPTGQDEVRAADGTTCRSAVSGTGAYLDVGVIGNPNSFSSNSNSSAYGRFVIPLGKKPVRLDCSRLYNVEVRRLELELKLMELGLTRGIAPVSELSSPEEGKETEVGDGTQVAQASSGGAWDEDGWSLEGRNE